MNIECISKWYNFETFPCFVRVTDLYLTAMAKKTYHITVQVDPEKEEIEYICEQVEPEESEVHYIGKVPLDELVDEEIIKILEEYGYIELAEA